MIHLCVCDNLWTLNSRVWKVESLDPTLDKPDFFWTLSYPTNVFKNKSWIFRSYLLLLISRYSEKATKIWNKLPIFLTSLSSVKENYKEDYFPFLWAFQNVRTSFFLSPKHSFKIHEFRNSFMWKQAAMSLLYKYLCPQNISANKLLCLWNSTSVKIKNTY